MEGIAVAIGKSTASLLVENFFDYISADDVGAAAPSEEEYRANTRSIGPTKYLWLGRPHQPQNGPSASVRSALSLKFVCAKI